MTKTAHEDLYQEYQKGLNKGTLESQFMSISSTDIALMKHKLVSLIFVVVASIYHVIQVLILVWTER